jgi:origin recognition complex subunit 2
MSLDDQDSDFYSELDSTTATPSRARRASSLSRASDFTTDDDNQAAAVDHGSSLVTLTSFDAYFHHTSRPSRTSSNIFSQLVQPLSLDEYAASLSRSFYPHPFPFPLPSSAPSSRQSQTGQPLGGEEETATAHHRAYIPRYILELAEGFNLLFCGFGSKRRALNDLARACACAHTTRAYSCYAHVLVLNGFLPSFSARDIFAALARLPGAPQSVEDVAQFLTAEPPPASTSPSSSSSSSSSVQKPRQQRRRRLVLVVHNIDAPALRSPKVRALLNALVSIRGVQIAASIDHINAPMIWTSTEFLSRKWLWHDLTTLASYDVELAAADPASLRGGAPTTATAAAATALMRVGGESMNVGGGGGGGGGVMMTETAARHVLVAVTQRARKLFMLMGRRQLDGLADNAGAGAGGVGVVEPTTPAGAVEVAVPYDTLFNLARDNFVATNDTALRALLGEFRDHGLVVTVGTGVMGSGEMLWIPLRKERLTKLLDGLAEQGEPP